MSKCSEINNFIFKIAITNTVIEKPIKQNTIAFLILSYTGRILSELIKCVAFQRLYIFRTSELERFLKIPNGQKKKYIDKLSA